MNTTNLSNLAFAVGGWANALPANVRKRFYQSLKVVSGLATLALLVIPALPGLGVTLPANFQWAAILTGLLTFTGHLADRNTVLPTPLDTTPAPESSADVTPPAPTP